MYAQYVHVGMCQKTMNIINGELQLQYPGWLELLCVLMDYNLLNVWYEEQYICMYLLYGCIL